MNQEPVSTKTLKDALLLAGKNVEFGEHLMTSPELFRAEYNLTDEQVEQIRSLKNISAPFDEAGLMVANYEDGGGGGGGGGDGGRGGGDHQEVIG